MDGLRDLDAVAEVAVPETVNAQLRPYQVEGFRWLAFLREHHLGGILADDMGLGKTLQTLALIDYDLIEREAQPTAEPTVEHVDQHAAETRVPFLVVAPTSVVANWMLEARKFTPTYRDRGGGDGEEHAELAQAVAGADRRHPRHLATYSISRPPACSIAGVIFMKPNSCSNDQEERTGSEAGRRPVPVGDQPGGPDGELADPRAVVICTTPRRLFPTRSASGDHDSPIESRKIRAA